jgi:regulator of nucleoside diphosphate kinase
MSHAPEIIVTSRDLERLRGLIGTNPTPAAERLERELSRAEVVDPEAVPADTVTMNSDVTFEDLASGARRTIRLVYPTDANAERGHVSVLAPMGSALLGLRVGQEIEWPTPGGVRRVRVVEVLYQPERAGHFDL